MMNILLFAFLIKISLCSNLTNIIVLPFKTYKKPYNISEFFNISTLINNHLYTEIEISNQILAATLRSDEYGFYMTSKDCIDKSNYIIQKSESFVNLTNFTQSKNGFASERMLLYRDIDLKKQQLGLFTKMRVMEYNNKIQCAIFGLKMESDIYEYIQSFIKTFKLNTNIKSLQWTLKYNSDDEGLLVLGDSPIEYDPIFKNKNYTEHKVTAIKYKTYFNFGIHFNEIIINNRLLNFQIDVQFYHELGVIFVNQIFYDNITDIFFQKYISQYICERKWVIDKYGYIRCHEANFTDSDIQSFPTIYFKQVDMYYTFELSYKDLFSKQPDRFIYFLIMFDISKESKNEIKFGKPFLKKYPLTVDNEKHTISFFLKEEEINNNNNTLIIVVILLSIFFVILLFLLLFFIYKYVVKNKKNKIRANELDDDYDYTSKENYLDADKEQSPDKPKDKNIGIEFGI